LLTHYRGFRESGPKGVLFLFDEPASNLHSSAQAELLESFEKFPDNCSIIYTTHSHHMINPAWLENTLVVKNKALDYNQNDDDYTTQRAEVSLEKYREFAVNHPDQTTYFQPILDI
jgi:predicted ATP-dependent endonuclease of OLD family